MGECSPEGDVEAGSLHKSVAGVLATPPEEAADNSSGAAPGQAAHYSESEPKARQPD